MPGATGRTTDMADAYFQIETALTPARVLDDDEAELNAATPHDTPEYRKTRKLHGHWLLDFLGVRSAQTRDLAKLTGVKVTLGGEGSRKG